MASFDQTSAAEILVIGCGGGTLATMLPRADRRVTVVDVDPDSIAVAQRYFSMDGRVSCAVGDGLEWSGESVQKFDCIVVDAFEGCKVPAHLCLCKFFRLVASRLPSEGP